MGHTLHGGRPCPNHSHPFIAELTQPAKGIATGIGIIPATRVKSVALKLVDAFDTG